MQERPQGGEEQVPPSHWIQLFLIFVCKNLDGCSFWLDILTLPVIPPPSHMSRSETRVCFVNLFSTNISTHTYLKYVNCLHVTCSFFSFLIIQLIFHNKSIHVTLYRAYSDKRGKILFAGFYRMTFTLITQYSHVF